MKGANGKISYNLYHKPFVFEVTARLQSNLSSTTPGVTVIPNNPDPAHWFEENPVLASVIIIGGFLFILIIILFCWVRYKRKKWERKNKSSQNDEEGRSETTTPKPDRRISSASEIFGDSFVIIQTPLSKRRESKPKRTLAVPPMFSVNQRKPSRTNYNPTRRATVHFARWSNEGLEIREAGVLGERKRAQSTSASDEAARSKSTNPEVIVGPIPLSPHAPNPTSNRMVYRRVSQGQHHAIYAPEAIKPRQLSKEI